MDYSPFARLDSVQNGTAPVMNNNIKKNNNNKSNSIETNDKQQQQNDNSEENDEFWKNHNIWKSEVLSSNFTVTVRDPQQQPRTWSNPNPPVMYLVISAEMGFSVRRRYSDFEFLRMILLKKYCGIMIPPLPEKKMVGSKEQNFLRIRMRGLGFFLERIVSNPFLRSDPTTFAFLSLNDPNGWNDLKKKESIPQPSSSAVSAAVSLSASTTSTIASATASATSFFSSLTSAATGTTSTSASTIIPPIDDMSTPVYNVNFSVDLNATDSEGRWRAAIYLYTLPENFDRLINDVRSQLESLDQVMKALVQSSAKTFSAASAYAQSIRDFNIQYEQVLRVEAASSDSTRVEFANKSGKDLLEVLQKMGTTFKLWGEAAAGDPNILEQLLHEVLRYELLIIREVKRMMSIRDSMVTERDRILRLQRSSEQEKETADKTGKSDRSSRAALKIQEYQKELKNHDFLLNMMNKGLFLDTLDNFAASKINTFKELIGRLAASFVTHSRLNERAWLSSIESLHLDFDLMNKKATITLEGAKESMGLIGDGDESTTATSNATDV